VVLAINSPIECQGIRPLSETPPCLYLPRGMSRFSNAGVSYPLTQLDARHTYRIGVVIFRKAAEVREARRLGVDLWGEAASQ
jgi:hypothetical protein